METKKSGFRITLDDVKFVVRFSIDPVSLKTSCMIMRDDFFSIEKWIGTVTCKPPDVYDESTGMREALEAAFAKYRKWLNRRKAEAIQEFFWKGDIEHSKKMEHRLERVIRRRGKRNGKHTDNR